MALILKPAGQDNCQRAHGIKCDFHLSGPQSLSNGPPEKEGVAKNSFESVLRMNLCVDMEL